jgi:hypothetical protein
MIESDPGLDGIKSENRFVRIGSSNFSNVALKLKNDLRIKTRSLLPEGVKEYVRSIRRVVNSLLYHGNRRYCPVCEKSSRRFGKTGIIPREDAKCMCCGALERHRFVWLYFRGMTDLLNRKPKKVLHVAPEPCFRQRLLKELGLDYVTADLSDPRAAVKMDITDIQFPDESFDVIYCSHVLEHVQEDKQAMREFHRVLKRDGWAILLVPITAERTFEDPRITDPVERLRFFGQEDHVRCYGPDYVERLREAGFTVKTIGVGDIFTENERAHLGLTSASGEIYFCTKA